MCRRKMNADERDDGALFDERAFQSVDGGVDEVRTVVDGNDIRARGQARSQLRHALLHVIDHVERIEPEPLESNATRNLTLAVQLGNTAPFVGAEFDPGHIAQQNRCAVIDLDDDLAEIINAAQVRLAAHDIFKFGKL